MSTRICKECKYYKPDYGIHCFNGWTDPEGSRGKCMVDPKPIYREAKDIECKYFIEKYPDNKSLNLT